MILFLVVAGQLVDLLTWFPAIGRYGIQGESSGFASAAYSAAGLSGVVLLKTGGVAIMLGIALWIATRSPSWRRPWLGRFLLLFASAAGILGAVSNLTALAL